MKRTFCDRDASCAIGRHGFRSAEVERYGELAVTLCMLMQYVLKISKVEQVVDLVTAQVEVNGAVRRLDRLLQKQKALDQGGFSGLVCTQKHGNGLEINVTRVFPCLEVGETQSGKHYEILVVAASSSGWCDGKS